MKNSKLTFDMQMTIGIILLGFSFLLSGILDNTVFINLAWIVYGIMFIIHPAWPQRADFYGEKKCKMYARLAGVICVVIGLVIRTGLG